MDFNSADLGQVVSTWQRGLWLELHRPDDPRRVQGVQEKLFVPVDNNRQHQHGTDSSDHVHEEAPMGMVMSTWDVWPVCQLCHRFCQVHESVHANEGVHGQQRSGHSVG